MSRPERDVARIIAKLERILAWWRREQQRSSSGTALAGEIETLVAKLKRDYPDAADD